MKVIMAEDMKGIGKTGELVVVKDGYARNFLIPQGKAMLADKGNLARVESIKRQRATVATRLLNDAKTLQASLAETSIEIAVQAGEEDKIFGSVTTQMIADALAEKGITIDRRKIELEEPIKAIGVFIVPVRLHPEVIAELKVWVQKME